MRADRRFQRSRRSQQMARRSLRRRHERLLRRRAKHTPNREHLRPVSDLSSRSVRVDVPNLTGVDSRLAKQRFHAGFRAQPFRMGRCDVVRVAVAAASDHFAVALRNSALRLKISILGRFERVLARGTPEPSRRLLLPSQTRCALGRTDAIPGGEFH